MIEQSHNKEDPVGHPPDHIPDVARGIILQCVQCLYPLWRRVPVSDCICITTATDCQANDLLAKIPRSLRPANHRPAHLSTWCQGTLHFPVVLRTSQGTHLTMYGGAGTEQNLVEENIKT